MNIGLIDVDGHSGFPNLAQMKLSAYHKSIGDSVERWDGLKHYDKVYMSKVFTFTPDEETWINADEVVRGGLVIKTIPPCRKKWRIFSPTTAFIQTATMRLAS